MTPEHSRQGLRGQNVRSSAGLLVAMVSPKFVDLCSKTRGVLPCHGPWVLPSCPWPKPWHRSFWRSKVLAERCNHGLGS